LFANKNYELRGEMHCLRDVRPKIPRRDLLSAEMNNASALRIGVPLCRVAMTIVTMTAHVAPNRTKCLSVVLQQTVVLCGLHCHIIGDDVFVALLGNLLHWQGAMGLVPTGPVMLRGISSVNESWMHESCMRMLCIVPHSGNCAKILKLCYSILMMRTSESHQCLSAHQQQFATSSFECFCFCQNMDFVFILITI